MPRPANPHVRERLRTAGGDLIHGSSFHATGVQDIVLAAEVPKGSFYNYFASKEAFVEDVLDRYWEEISESYGHFLLDGSSFVENSIKNFFCGLIEYHENRGFVPGCLIGNLALELASTSDSGRSKLRRIFAQWTELLAVRLNDKSRGGACMRGEEIAASLIDAFEGAVLRAKVDQSPIALKRFRDFVLPRLLA